VGWSTDCSVNTFKGVSTPIMKGARFRYVVTLTNLYKGVEARYRVGRYGGVRADGGSCVKGVADQQRVYGRLFRGLGSIILVHVPRGDSGTVDSEGAVAENDARLSTVHRCVRLLGQAGALSDPYAVVCRDKERREGTARGLGDGDAV
jgi:hypothetical protein